MAAGDVTVTYMNNTQQSDLNILVYQTPIDPSISTMAVAWLTLTDIAADNGCSFTYPDSTTARVRYTNANGLGAFTPNNLMQVTQGQEYSFQQLGGGYTLVQSVTLESGSPEIDIVNNSHVVNGIDAQLFKNGMLLAVQSEVASGIKAAFVMKPKIYFVIASDIEEGQTFDTAQLSETPTEIDLTGLSSLTVALTGDVTNGYTFTWSNAQSVQL